VIKETVKLWNMLMISEIEEITTPEDWKNGTFVFNDKRLSCATKVVKYSGNINTGKVYRVVKYYSYTVAKGWYVTGNTRTLLNRVDRKDGWYDVEEMNLSEMLEKIQKAANSYRFNR